jgi:hypothetical protein
MRDAGCAQLSSRIEIIVAGAEALAAPDDDAPTRFDHALSRPGIGRWPFER